MGASKYNGIILPNQPAYNTDVYRHAVIVYGLDTYGVGHHLLWLSSEPFLSEGKAQSDVLGEHDVFSYPASANVIGYSADANASYTWDLGAIIKDDGPADRYTMSGLFVWCNVDIYKAADPTAIAFEATEPVPIIPQTPVIVSLTGGGTYDSGGNADPLKCVAEVSDGGSLSYKWYRNGTVCSYASTHTPSTKDAGAFEYYCVVTNTLFGDKVTAQSDTLTVTINAVDVPEPPEVVEKRKPAEIIGYVLRQAGVPMAEAVALMIANIKKTASLYLYGTPSTTGNIGLRVGDSVTYYDGFVLPKLPDSKYTCFCATPAIGVTVNPTIYMIATPPLEVDNWDSVQAVGEQYEATGTPIEWWHCYHPYTEWEFQRESAGAAGLIKYYDIGWSNMDIHYADDYNDESLSGTLARAKDEYIPVTGIVDYIGDVPIYEVRSE